MTQYDLYPATRIDGGTRSVLREAHRRLGFLIFIFMFAFMVMIVRTIDLGMVNTNLARASMPVVSVPGLRQVRSDIVDREGRVLATSLETASLYANATKVDQPGKLAAELVSILPDLNYEKLKMQLQSNKRFFWIKRRLTPNQQWQINALGYSALQFQQEDQRIYPHGPLASHILGLVTVDGAGIGGVEKFFDKRLTNPGRRSDPLRLSVDIRIQHIMRSTLAEAMRAHGAEGAAGLVMKVDTGEILALVSLPDFDPNDAGAGLSDHHINRASHGVYELGSTFKTFTFAAALETNTVSFEDSYDATKPLRVGRFLIRDDHPKKRVLSVPEIFAYSSNIGTAQMVEDLGIDQQRFFLEGFGLLRTSSLELAEIGRPLLPAKWGPVESKTISYGHGLAVTPIHLAQGIATVVNGGWPVQATLVADPDFVKAHRPERILSDETSRKMRQLLRLAVTEGTGSHANSVGYLVGGKTGTADKPTKGGYDRRATISSFVGTFPIDDPQYVVFALLDSPQGTEATFGYRGGGWTAAPVVGAVIERSAPLLGVQPKKDDDTLYREAMVMMSDPKKKGR